MKSISGVLMDRLPGRVLGALYRNGVSTLEELSACPEEHVRCGIGIGAKTMSEIRSFLRSTGRGFAPPRDFKGCECALCTTYRKRRLPWPRLTLNEVREDDRPLPENVLPFRPTRNPR
jgi:hypothetical protein